MTICFFSAQYLPTVGGVERYTWNLARRVTAAGHRAIVVTSALPGLPAQETGPDGIRICRLPSLPLMGGRFPVVRPFARETRQLAASLWAEQPDFCLIQTRFYPLSLWAARGARRRNIPAIVVDHSTGHMPMGLAPLNALAALYEHAAFAFLRRQGPAFYGVSEAVCGWLRHFGAEPAGTLYNAVDPDELAGELEAASSLPSWRARLGLAPDTKLIAFAGRLIPEKGAGLLLDAFALLPEAQRAKTALVLAGDGPELQALRARCPAGAYFAGSLAHPEALRLFSEADLYCLPTRYAEGFPTTLLEAAACGCAILCSDTAGSAELLPDESFGLRLAPDTLTPQTLAAALQKALSNDAWRAGAAQKARARLAGQFSWAAVAEKLLKVAEAAQP